MALRWLVIPWPRRIRYSPPRRNACTGSIERSIRRDPIANAGLGLDEARIGLVVLELAAQLPDEHAQILQVLGMCRSPDGGQDLSMGEDPAGIAHQERQEVEFLGGEFERGPVLARVMLGYVNGDLSMAQYRCRMADRIVVAQGGTDACQKLANAEGLVHIVVGAEIERFDLFHLAVARRDDDDRNS